MRPAVVLILVAAALCGCGDRASIQEGGRTPGQVLTVYTLVPGTPDGTDLVRGAKLALAAAGGHVGPVTVQFASALEPENNVEGVASAVRDIVRDTGTIAVIGDLDPRTAAVSAPLLNAVGLLQVTPLGPVRFAEPGPRRTLFAFGPTPGQQADALVAAARGPIAVEAEPGGQALAAAIRSRAGHTVATARARTVVYAGSDPVNARGAIAGILRENRRARVLTTVPVDLGPRVRTLGPAAATPPGFAAAFPGVRAGRYASAGYTAMNAVLDALRRAGDPQRRSAVIRAFRAPATTPLSVRG